MFILPGWRWCSIDHFVITAFDQQFFFYNNPLSSSIIPEFARCILAGIDEMEEWTTSEEEDEGEEAREVSMKVTYDTMACVAFCSNQCS